MTTEFPADLRAQALRNAEWHGEPSEPTARPWSVVHYDPIEPPPEDPMTTENTTATETPKYTVIDRDTGERFAGTDYGSRYRAERRRNELALKYGKETCLGIGEINAAGEISDVTEDAGTP